MMAGMGKTGIQDRSKSSGPGQSCCKTVPNTPVTMFTPSAQRAFHEAILVDGTTAGYISKLTVRVDEDRTPPDRKLRAPSQAVLCTFRI
jgi:hypothetical protein